MGVVGSLPSPPPPRPLSPSPPPPSISNDTNEAIHRQSISSTDDYSCSNMMIDEMDSITNCSSHSSLDQRKKIVRRPKPLSPLTVMYGPINIRVRQSAAPTLATGRRSKFAELQGDAAAKREIRRKRNRDAAKKLKEKRGTIEDDLSKQINEYEMKEKELALTIESLRTYKEYLESQCQQVISIQKERLARSPFQKVEQTRRRLHQSVPVYRDNEQIKGEPRSPSPQWQLLFSI